MGITYLLTTPALCVQQSVRRLPCANLHVNPFTRSKGFPCTLCPGESDSFSLPMSLIHGETPSLMIPKYSMSGPFRGHMSMKSSPLFPGSSCSLSTQFLIQDHISTHYRKLNSAKDRDQQNKERLLRAVEKFKKELQQICTTSHHQPQSNFPEQGRVNYRHMKTQVDETGKHSNTRRARSQTNSPVLTAREVMGNMEKEHGDVNPRTSVNQSLQRKKKTYNNPQKQTYSGDLLDKHPTSFTNSKKPFKPRLLKKPSQSFLSKYRYYTAPTKKISQKTSSPQVNHQDKTKLYRSMEDVHLPMKKINLTPRSRAENQWNMAKNYKEEDLKYLRFLEEITNDIILRSCRSDSAMELVFQDHLHRKQPDIDEVKKKVLVQELRDELERSVKSDVSISYDGTQHGPGNPPSRGNLNKHLSQ
ncbi:spermatogenesis-associated protein 7 homolog isoform X2 [Phyllobates terribilis]|uniref:spermatogenesis-associated protein 7 homolog isoform X2 n=1 Tax=Phyllobates terribilis TaxID=111132 RepID=UPI003CCA88B5